MATFNITTTVNILQLTGKATSSGDTFNINGGYLTYDQDTYWGRYSTYTSSASASLIGSITISSSLGGTIDIDGRNIYWIPYTGGSGSMWASASGDVLVWQGSVGAQVIGFCSDINTIPVSYTATAIPASGYIKVRGVIGGSFTSGGGALSFIGGTSLAATISGDQIVAPMLIVGASSGNHTCVRLGNFLVRGNWYSIGTTSGSSSTTYQLPTQGMTFYLPGVYVETSSGSGTYEYYPCAGTAAANTIATDDFRGKYCWISTAGLLRFGSDGTNTGGYIPPSGRHIRMPNIIMAEAAGATPGTIILPSATLTTRPEFATTGGGVLSFDKANISWYLNCSQFYSFALTNCGVHTAITLSEGATPYTISDGGVGQEAANSQTALNISLCPTGGIISNFVSSRAAIATQVNIAALSDSSDITISNSKFISVAARGNASATSLSLSRITNASIDDIVLGGALLYFSTCTDIDIDGVGYYDHPLRRTGTATATNAFNFIGLNSNITISDFNLGGLTATGPGSHIAVFGAAKQNNIKFRNFGTKNTPILLADTTPNDATWSRASTTCTVTKTNHGLVVGQSIFTTYSSSTTAFANLTNFNVVSTADANTFTFTCSNAGATSGTLSYILNPTPTILTSNSGAAAYNILVQRCYVNAIASQLVATSNDSTNFIVENVYGLAYGSTNTGIAALNTNYRNIGSITTGYENTGVYGSHYFSTYAMDEQADVINATYAFSGTTITVNKTNHNLPVNSFILITSATDGNISRSIVQVTNVLTADTFTFTSHGTPSGTGTLSYTPLNGALIFLMNEATSQSSSYITLTNGAAFTSAGTLYMPTIGQSCTIEMKQFVKGLGTSFPPARPVNARTISNAIQSYKTEYQIDTGTGWNGTWKNLALYRTGTGTSGGNTITVATGASDIKVGDRVYPITAASYFVPGTYVTDVTGTTVTLSANIVTSFTSQLLIFGSHAAETLNNSGTKLKIKMTTESNNTNTPGQLCLFTNTTSAQRDVTYPLDTVPVSVTVKDVNTGTALQNARVRIVETVGGNVVLEGVTNASGVLTGTTEYAGSNITGKVRRATVADGTLYKPSIFSGTVDPTSGFSTTILMIPD